MAHASQLADLGPDRRWLIHLMQQINFGRIENLRIRDGDPMHDPLPRIVREVKFAGDNSPRSEAEIGDFTLKRQVQDLLAQLDRIENGTVDVLIVKHGLPFSMQVAESTSAA